MLGNKHNIKLSNYIFEQNSNKNKSKIYGATQLAELTEDYNEFYDELKEKTVEYELKEIIDRVNSKINHKLAYYNKVKGLISIDAIEFRVMCSYGGYRSIVDERKKVYVNKFELDVLREVVNRLIGLKYNAELVIIDDVYNNFADVIVYCKLSEEDDEKIKLNATIVSVDLDISNKLFFKVMENLNNRILEIQRIKDVYGKKDSFESIVAEGLDIEFKNTIETIFKYSEEGHSNRELDYMVKALENLGYRVSIKNKYEKEKLCGGDIINEDVLSYVYISW